MLIIYYAVKDPGNIITEITEVTESLCRHLSAVSGRWFQIGVLLGVDVPTLREFEHGNNPLRAMLQQWLNNYTGMPTVEHVVEATRHSAGGSNHTLADEILTKYKK